MPDTSGHDMHLMFTTVLAASVVAPRDPSTIVNGQLVESCAWPSVVRVETMGGTVACSGTLVHPEIVATASHCLVASGGTFARALFGESDANVFAREIELCEINPEYPVDAATTAEFDNSDFAFCKLAEPVTNVPIIPIAYGCELDAVQPGIDVYTVGFGATATAAEDWAIKRFGPSTLTEIDVAGELVFESVSCYGDSGGGYFMQLPGGELRQIGIVSYGQTVMCNSASVATAASGLVPFVLEMTGIDIAPCHAIDGTWMPDSTCRGVPLEPNVGGPGSYADGCPTGELSGFETTCGPAFDASSDTTPPTVTIVSPHSGDMIASAGAQTQIDITMAASDDDGLGIAFVELVLEQVDGAPQTNRRVYPPYEWAASLADGAYYLRGEAEDIAGNRGVSAWVAIGIGVDAPPPRDDDGADTSGGSSSSSDDGESTATIPGADTVAESGEGTDGGATDEQGEGCGCQSAPTSAPLFVLLAAIRRFTRRAARP
ncbi:MAG TPA: trypsin-like serine protease [Nannocystaceae bacterium]|nr:trypsin-like serine protease [Nannocystaceae bacterium]